MGKHRSSYSPQFKAQGTLEALRGERSQAAERHSRMYRFTRKARCKAGMALLSGPRAPSMLPSHPSSHRSVGQQIRHLEADLLHPLRGSVA